MSKKPVIFELDDSEISKASTESGMHSVVDAPPVPDVAGALIDGGGTSKNPSASVAPKSQSTWLGRLFWGLVAAVLGTVVSVAAWDFATGLILRWPVLGWAISAGIIALLLVVFVFVARELAALSRMRRVDGLRQLAEAVRTRKEADMGPARRFVAALDRFYEGRPDLSWGRARLEERGGEVLDGDALLEMADDLLLAPLDRAAELEITQAARQVATVTALVPLALADVATALLASTRMIRRISQIYGGRSGFFGSWRLARSVFAHLVATGAVAVGDDLLEPVLGGSVLSKLSRRFGEGLVNGALTARVGIAAMEVCRPMPFPKDKKPRIRHIIQRAFSGFGG